jgi:hypothetical protein
VPCYALTAKCASHQTNSISSSGFPYSNVPWIVIFDVHVNKLRSSCLALTLLCQTAALVLSSLSLVSRLKITSLVVLFCCRSRDTAVGVESRLSALQPLNRGWIPGMGKISFSPPGRLDQILANRPRVQSVAVKWRTHKVDPVMFTQRRDSESLQMCIRSPT